jgi:hypothetical protein
LVDDTNRYSAFVSYRHMPRDRQWAVRIMSELEAYRTPKALQREAFPDRIGQRAELLVPFGLKGIRDAAIAEVNQHEAVLREFCLDLRPLDRAAPETIGLFIAGFDLSAEFEHQLDDGRGRLLGDQRADRMVDG